MEAHVLMAWSVKRMHVYLLPILVIFVHKIMNVLLAIFVLPKGFVLPQMVGPVRQMQVVL